jgi:hypothetical protein
MADETPELRVVVDTARELTGELGGHYRPDDVQRAV